MPGIPRASVYRLRKSNRPYKDGSRVINEGLFIKTFPNARKGPGATYKLTRQQLLILPDPDNQ